MTSTLNLLPMPSPSLAPSCSAQVARVTQALLHCRSPRRWLGRVALVDSKWWSRKDESASARRKKHGTMRVESSQATSEAAEHSGGGDGEEVAESAIGLSTLEQFIELNAGSWTGTFTQYDVLGNVLHCIPTKLSATSYGKGENISLIQTLEIKEATSNTRTSDEDDEPVWQEFKLVETNLFTIDRRQQVGFFPGERAYTVSHQTAEMLDKVLRIGVLGEDDDEDEEFPKGVKLPSRRPALVCESCLYSEDAQSRVRAFHVLDPRGLLDVIGVFHESREGESFAESQKNLANDSATRVDAVLGKWSGQLVTRRTGIYGATLAECNVQVHYERDDEGKMKQEVTTTRGEGTKIVMHGTSTGAVMRFEGGLLTTLLPGGMGLTSPGSVGQSVGRKQAFYFEFSWIQSPVHRRRLVRTYDTDGLVVSTSLATESKLLQQ